MAATTFIYGLGDPDTGEIRYVGKANDPEGRLRQHLKDGKVTAKTMWLSALKAEGKAPKLSILLEVPFFDWQYWEKAFIERFTAEGYPLVNSCPGGEGIMGLPATPSIAELWKEINKVLSLRHGGKHAPVKTDWVYHSMFKVAQLLHEAR